MNDLIRKLAQSVDSESPRAERAHVAAELVRGARNYRWVGIYDVGDDEIVLIGHTGSSPPAHARFAIDRGLSGEALRARRTVVSGDVARDPRYLAAFESTASEAIVPILGAETAIPIGTLDVQSDRLDAFSREDVEFLEECASVLRPLYD